MSFDIVHRERPKDIKININNQDMHALAYKVEAFADDADDVTQEAKTHKKEEKRKVFELNLKCLRKILFT